MSDDTSEKQLEAFQYALGQNLVGIVGKGDDGVFGRQIGTGTLVDIDGNPFILTAAHVVANCALNELRFFLPSPGGRIVEQGDRVKIDPSFVILREPLELDLIRKDDNLDVAILRLSGSAVIRPFWSFRQIRRLPMPTPQPVHYVTMGFPGQRAVPFLGPDLMVLPNIDYLEVIDPGSRAFRDFDPKTHFLTDFPSAEKFHPGGYSGGGLWGHAKGDGNIWHPIPEYFGMVTGYYERIQALKILSVNTILDFIDINRSLGSLGVTYNRAL